MMYAEDELVPLSAIQHLLFCPRQCALIHLERLWAENVLTVEGQHLHEKAHEGRTESRLGVRMARGLPLRSLRLGLSGQSDVVEFQRDGDHEVAFPIEYKRGQPKAHEADRVQLCAQALCLEEMLQITVPAGALFYGKTRRRQDVTFDLTLRQLTEDTARQLHDLIASGRTPPAIREPKCEACSLIDLCMPKRSGQPLASSYLHAALQHAMLHLPESP